MFSYLCDKRWARIGLYDQQSPLHCFNDLKEAKTDQEKIKWILRGKLPFEVSATFAGSSLEIWMAIGENMPIMATLKNLATFERYDIQDKLRPIIEGKLNDREALSKSKILPFRFLDAFSKVKTPWLKDVLRTSIEYTFDNLPDVKGKTVVFLDISGSMEINNLPTAALFALGIMKKTNNGEMYLFDTSLYNFSYSKVDSILTQVEKIKSQGGTHMGIALPYLIQEKKSFDNIILITDEQQNMGDPFLNLLAEYKQKINKDVKTFIINVAAENGSLLPVDKNTFYIYGMSDKILQFIAFQEDDIDEMVRYIKDFYVTSLLCENIMQEDF